VLEGVPLPVLVGREVGFVPNGLLFVIGFVLSEGSGELDCWLRGVDVLGVGVTGAASPPETMVSFRAILCCPCELVCGPDECDRLGVRPGQGC